MNIFVCTYCSITIITTDEEDVLYCEACGYPVARVDEEDINEVVR